MRILGILGVLCFIALTFFLWKGLSLNPRELPSVHIGRSMPHFQLLTLDGKQATWKEMQGHPFILHVFASWCYVCAEETRFLMEIAELPLYGLNYQDDPKDAAHFLSTYGNPYRMVLLDTKGDVGLDLGVYGTPETFLVDKHGVICLRHAGILNEAVWGSQFQPILEKWHMQGEASCAS